MLRSSVTVTAFWCDGGYDMEKGQESQYKTCKWRYVTMRITISCPMWSVYWGIRYVRWYHRRWWDLYMLIWGSRSMDFVQSSMTSWIWIQGRRALYMFCRRRCNRIRLLLWEPDGLSSYSYIKGSLPKENIDDQGKKTCMIRPIHYSQGNIWSMISKNSSRQLFF